MRAGSSARVFACSPGYICGTLPGGTRSVGYTFGWRGELDRASELYSAAMEGFDAVGDRRCTASTVKNLGVLAARRGAHGESHDLFRRGFMLRYELGDEAGLAECREGLAGSVSAPGGRATRRSSSLPRSHCASSQARRMLHRRHIVELIEK